MKMTDDLNVTLNELDCLIDEWEEASVVQVTFETSFKSWESAQKTALMDSGLSAVRAEAQIRGSEEWSKYFSDLQMQNIRVEKKRKQIEACKLRFKAAQTYHVDARTMTEF